MSSKQDSELWNGGLRLVSYCPVCETRYNPMQARVLGQDEETHLLHVRCRKCFSSILALVLVNQVGASSVGLLTDLTYDDVVRFRSNSCVSINDVMDIHSFLDDCSWDKLINPKQQEKVKRKAKKQKQK